MKLQELYKETLRPRLQKELGLSNVMQIPTIQKVSLNMGLGQAMTNRKLLDQAMEEMRIISGQKPVTTVARKSIAGFKLREGYPIGCKVTLRHVKMWQFLEKVIHICLPRVRDFRGLNPKSFDAFGNYSFGIKEQLIFPEIEFDKIDEIRGMDVVVRTSSTNTEHSFALLKALGFPFETN